jgi:multidrug resistance efflux pump
VNRALILFFLLSIAMTAFSAPATTQSTQPSKDENVVKRGTIRAHIDVDGFFEPIDPQEVRFRPDAYQGDLKIVSLVEHGAKVKKGDVVLELDSESLKNQFEAAQAELANTKAAQAKAQADLELGEQADQIALKVQEKDLENAKAALKWFDDVDGKQMFTNAELQTKTAKAAVDDQSDELDQLKKMYKSEELTNATADIVVKRALRNLEIAKTMSEMAVEREDKTKQFDFDRERSKLVFAVDQQTNSLAQLKVSQAQSAMTRKTAVDTANAALERQQMKVDDLKRDLADFTVKAGFDGVVYYGQLVGGAWQNSGPVALRVDDRVGVNQIVMTLFAPGKLRVEADMPESHVLWVKPGDKARIVPLSDHDAITEGTCRAIIPAAGNPSFAMPVDPEKVDPRLVPGEHASVQMDLPPREDVLIAPVDAIVHGRARVKLSKGKEEWRNVVTGFADEKHVEIKSGLEEGDILVVEK